MAFKVLIAGVLIFSPLAGFSADATTTNDNQSSQSDTRKTDKAVQPAVEDSQAADKTSDKAPDNADKKPEEDASEPDCE